MGLAKRFYGKPLKFKVWVNGKLIRDENGRVDAVVDEVEDYTGLDSFDREQAVLDKQGLL